jgi:general secretion pathway protein F
MAMFSYRATDAAGNILQGTLEAREERQVVAHLQQGGLIPLRINLAVAATSWQERLPLRRGRIPSREVVNFTQELAALLKAGLPLDRSLKALEQVTSRSAMKAVLSQVLRDLQEGKTLGDFLEEALDRLGDYLKTVSEFRSYLLTALIYPMILAGVGGLSLILMLLYVVPRFESFFKDMGQSLYWSTILLIGLSQALRSYWWVGLLLAVGAALGLRSLVKSSEGQFQIDRFKMKAPFLGDLSRRVAAVFFAKTLGTLLANGVPMVTSLRVVIASVNNRFMAKSLKGVLGNVEKGQQLSGLLKKVGLFPELFLQMTAIGEETGHLADMLLSAAGSLENDAREAVRRLLALLEPVLILVTSLVVAFIIISLLLPILNLYEIQF